MPHSAIRWRRPAQGIVPGLATSLAWWFTWWLTSAPATAQCQYEFIVVDAPGPPSTSVLLRDIANDGTAVGATSATIPKPLVVSPDGLVILLGGATFGGSINAATTSGLLVGSVNVTQSTWLPAQWINGAYVLLPTPSSVIIGTALGANEHGTIAGQCSGGSSNPIGACLWIDGAFVSLGIPGTSSAAIGVADDGTVGGWVHPTSTDEFQPFVWKDGVVTYLPRLPGTYRCNVRDVSATGLLVGECYSEDNEFWHATVWSGSVAIDVGVLPGYWRTRGESVNAFGQAVGQCEGFAGGAVPDTTFLWQDGHLYDLFTLLTSPFVGQMTGAWGINDRGDICGFGKAADGHSCGVILRPIRTRDGDATIDCTVDARDISAVLGFWGAQYDYDGGPADLNGDRAVDGADLAMVLGDWGP